MNMRNKISINMNMKEKVRNMNKYLLLICNTTKRHCLCIIALTIVSSFLGSLWPVQLGNICTDFSDGRISTIRDGLIPILTLGILFLLSEGLIIFRRSAMDCVIASHEADIRKRSIGKMLKMPVSFTFGEDKGEKRAAQLDQGIEGLSQLIRIVCNDVCAMVLTTSFILYQVVSHAPWIMAMIMLAYLGVSILISIAQIRSQNGIREAILDKKNTLRGQVHQAVAGLELIRSLNAETYEADRLCPLIDEISAAEKRHHLFMGRFDGIKKICAIAFLIVILMVSLVMVTHDQMAPGAVFTLCLLFQQMLRPLDDIYRFLDETASSEIKVKLLREMTDIKEDPVFEIADSIPVYTGNDTDIVLQDVAITTPGKDKTVARYHNLVIPGKEIVAIAGGSGCGKTSIIRCLNRFFPYVCGRITIMGRDLESYSQRELTDKVSYTPQVQYFFAGTIREILMVGLREDVGDKALIDALKNAALFDTLYRKAKENAFSEVTDESILSYRIGDGGAGLSGGECQRLTIARAFLRKPDVFIFDESTANIDDNTEETVLTNIEQYARKINAGVIYISHDDNVIRRCNHVIYLEKEIRIAS